MNISHDHHGTMLVLVLAFGAVAMVMLVGGVSAYTIFEHRVSLRQERRDAAFHVAEAGIEYHRWHLSVNPNDFQDGTGRSGPYTHEARDKQNQLIGYFSLDIRAPVGTSTVSTVTSTGWLITDPASTEQITAQLAPGGALSSWRGR